MSGLLILSVFSIQAGEKLPDPKINSPKKVIKMGNCDLEQVIVYEDSKVVVFLHISNYYNYLLKKCESLDQESSYEDLQTWETQIRQQLAYEDTVQLLDLPDFDHLGNWHMNTLEDELIVKKLMANGFTCIYDKKRNRYSKKLIIRTSEVVNEQGDKQVEVVYSLPGKKTLFSNKYQQL